MHNPLSEDSSSPDILKIVLIYAVFAGLWILLSDSAVNWLFGDATFIKAAQSLKGWLFVGVTSLLLYLLLKNMTTTPEQTEVPALHRRMVDWPLWQVYLFAVAITLVTLLVRESIAVSFGERQLLILYMFPVILSAALGGFGPGLVSTFIAALCADYFGLPPTGSFKIEQSYDLFQLGFLTAEGLLVSYISMMLHEARYQSERAHQEARTSLNDKARALHLLNGIAEGSTDAIFAKDLHGRYILFNQASARFVGKTPEDALGKDDTELFPPEQSAILQEHDCKVMQENQVVTFQESLDTHDGKTFFLSIKGPLHDDDGKVIGMFGISRDITGLKITEDALRRERDRGQRYLNTMQTIMVALDTEGRISMINRYGCELLGYRESELLGENWFKTCLPHPESMEVVHRVFRQLLVGDLKAAEYHENAVLCRDGSQRLIAWHNIPFKNEAGNIVGTLSAGEDVTERRRIESALQQQEVIYRSLFDNMLNGFAYCRMLYENGCAEDFIYLDVNQSFEAQTGLNDVVGRRVSEVIPGIREADPGLFDIYSRVALGGKPEHFETFVQALDMWFEVTVYCPKPEHFVAVFDVITERKKAELALRDSEARFRALVEQSMAGIYIIQNGQFRYVNPGFSEIFGYDSPQDLIGVVPAVDLVSPQDRELVLENISKRETGQVDAVHYTANGVRRDGKQIDLEVYGRPYEHEGQPAIIGILLDITARKTSEQQLRKLSLAVEQSPESIVITNLDAGIEYVNEAFVQNTGYSREEALGQNPRILQGKTPKATYDALWQCMTEGGTWQGEFYNKRKDGSEYIEHAIISPLRQPDGRITHYVAVKEDISRRVGFEAEVNRLAFYDPLTGLPNRALLLERTAQALSTMRHVDRHSALIMFNIDRFKNINDAAGQTIGDTLLQSVAERLSQTLHEGDVVARIAGDEFAILLTDLAPLQQAAVHRAMLVAERMHACLLEPFHIGNERITLSACLGIALFPGNDEDTPLDILRRANTALHHAKTKGSNQTAFFEGTLDVIAKQRFDVERELHLATTNGELRAFLQPQVAASGKIVGAEALVRWQHPQRGLIQPADFIPIAEESNLIIEIGIWMFTEVCRLLVSKDMAAHPIRIAVNISPRHFRQPDFVDQIKQILVSTGANPRHLTLEVTEGMLIDNIGDVIAKMKVLNAMGFHFSMDDFGTGYSSLSYLKRLPIHELKIDKSFIQDLTLDPEDDALVETILAVAKLMHVEVVAEGVETKEQAAFLNEHGTVIHQGYLFGRPEPAEKFIECINSKKS